MAYGSVLTDTVQSSTAGTPVVFKDGNGTQIGTLCRAWVNFNGTGTVAIRGSFNVSSITDNGTGDYTVNFTTAMPDANYAPIAIVGYTGAATTDVPRNCTGRTWSTTSFRFVNQVSGGSAVDYEYQSVAIFR